MNLNPSDGHIMDYTTGWDDGYNIGNVDTAFTKDYLNQTVWIKPVNRIAIVRHQKVFIFPTGPKYLSLVLKVSCFTYFFSFLRPSNYFYHLCYIFCSEIVILLIYHIIPTKHYCVKIKSIFPIILH